MQQMQLAILLDKHFAIHGLRKGLSMGELTLVWLTHALSQADHRMNRVQDWAKHRLTTLRGCGLESLTPLDVTDDRLADVLRLLSNDERVVTILEGVVRHALAQQHQEITGLFVGNPKRRTAQPTTEWLLEAFNEITLTIVSGPGFVQRHLPPLSALQQQLLALCGFSPAVYTQLTGDS